MIVVPDAINGLDVSSMQGRPNWKLVKEAGFDFVYIQSSRYSSTPELSFLAQSEGAREAGLLVGSYHFCSHDSDPIKQAGFYFRTSGGLGSKSGELPPMVDWEYCTTSKYPDHPKHCVTWIETFIGECQRLWYPDNANRLHKRHIVLYSYPNYCGSHQPALAASRVLGGYPLCYASYRQDGAVPLSTGDAVVHPLPKPWLGWSLCQYSGNVGVPVPGIKGACDRQVFNGSSGEFALFCGIYRPVHSSEFEVIE